MPIISLLTDFGARDYFVGAMKGVILARAPRATLVDITHEIPAHDVQAGAFTLLAAYEAFPAGTIHLAVVDPGVGSARRAVLVSAHGQLFLGPDNGLFSYVCERDKFARAYHLTNGKYFRADVSPTFHGRDIFAPVAAALAGGVVPEELGTAINDHVRLAPLTPERLPDGTLRACVIHLDHFGNCVTSLTRAELTDEEIARGARLEVGGRVITSFRRFFAEEVSQPGEPFAVWGSAGFLEIAVNRASAAVLLGIKRGQSVIIRSR